MISKYISHLTIKGHPVLKKQDIDLVNKKTGKPYSIIAFVGENGCGKTTLLNELFNYDKSEYIVDKELLDRPRCALYLRQGSVHYNALKEVRKLIDGKEMIPNKSSVDDLFGISLWNNSDVARIAGELGDSQITELIRDNKLNDISCGGEVSKLIDGAEHGYNITSFSSGQQEVLLKFRDIQDLGHDDFLLLDEPETSLHPRWQKQIISLIKELVSDKNGETPQIFIATHSEKVLESLIQDEDTLIVRLYKKKNVITHETIDQMSLFLPRVTFAELDYVVFHIPSLDYHDQLFTRVADLYEVESIFDVDKILKNHPFYDKTHYQKKWSQQTRTKTINYHTLPAYIRNYFHHPKPGKEPTEEELVKSIKFLQEIIKRIIQ